MCSLDARGVEYIVRTVKKDKRNSIKWTIIFGSAMEKFIAKCMSNLLHLNFLPCISLLGIDLSQYLSLPCHKHRLLMEVVILVHNSCKINNGLYTGNKYVACNCDELKLASQTFMLRFVQRYYIFKCVSKHCWVTQSWLKCYSIYVYLRIKNFD